MTPEQILAIPPRVLLQRQRERYFEDGFILLESIVPENWLAKLRAATQTLVERSRAVTKSSAVFDLEPDHTPQNPRLRRVSSPVDQHPDFWDYVTQSKLGDIVADLVGPDVKYHQSKLNFKWAKGGEEVKWHYDIPFWPHTNYSPLTVGTYLYDCEMDQGPVGFLPGSHRWRMPSQYDGKGRWTGCLSESRRHRHRSFEGEVHGRSRGFRDDPQLPHAARFAGQYVGQRSAAALVRPHLRRCLSLYAKPDSVPAIRRRNDSRHASALRSDRSRAVRSTARLVARLHVDFCPAAEREFAAKRRR